MAFMASIFMVQMNTDFKSIVLLCHLAGDTSRRALYIKLCIQIILPLPPTYTVLQRLTLHVTTPRLTTCSENMSDCPSQLCGHGGSSNGRGEERSYDILCF